MLDARRAQESARAADHARVRGEPMAGDGAPLGGCLGGQQRLGAEVDEVGGSGERHDRVGGRRRHQQRRQPGGERYAVDEQAGEIPEDRPLRERRPADEYLPGDQRHVRTWNHRHEHRPDEEENEQIERHTHQSIVPHRHWA